MGMKRKRWTIAVVATLLALGLAELIVRRTGVGPDVIGVHAENFRLSENPVLQYELVPGSVDGAGTTINRYGMRGVARPEEKGADVFRIACVGDSICFGLAVDSTNAFPAVLENLLGNMKGKRVEVLNFGVIGYNLPQVVEVVRTRVPRFHPDLVLYAYCMNDLQEYSFERDRLESLLSPAKRGYVRNSRRPSLRLWTLARYAWQSWSGVGVGENAGELPDVRQSDPTWVSLLNGSYDRYFERLHQSSVGKRELTRGLSDMRSYCDAMGADLRMVVFPVLMYYDRFPLEGARARVRHAAREQSIPCLDLYEVYRAYEHRTQQRIGLDALHPGVEGHRLTAESITERVRVGVTE